MQPVDRRAFVVLGMHRSGTSAVAGALAKLGAAAPRTMAPGAADNPKGFWESLPIVALNDELLASLGSSWDDWSSIDPQLFATPAAARLAERARRVLAAEFGNAPVIVLKDPRICRLAPFWLRLLEQENLSPLAVIALRAPQQVALSLQARNGFALSKGLLLWLRHVLDAESATRGLKRSFVAWDAFREDWRPQIARIGHELGVELPHGNGDAEADVDAFLDTGGERRRIAHDEAMAAPAMLEAVTATYASLQALARDPADRTAVSELDRARRLLEQSSSLFRPAFLDLATEIEQERTASGRRVAQLTGVLEQERAEASRHVAQLTAALEQQRADAGRHAAQLTAALEQERADAGRHAAQQTAALEQQRAEADRRLRELNETLDRERRDAIQEISRLTATFEQMRAVALAREAEHGAALQRERDRAARLEAEFLLVSEQLETALSRSIAGRSRALVGFVRRLARS